MNQYAHVLGGVVVEPIFTKNDEDLLMENVFVDHENWIDVTSLDPQPAEGWLYANGIFSKPPPPPGPSEEELQAQYEAQRQAFLAQANAEIEWRQDAVDLGIDQPGEKEDMQAWKIFRINVNRAVYPAAFPDLPQ